MDQERGRTEAQSNDLPKRIEKNALRCLLLQLHTRMILRVCSEELDVHVERKPESIDQSELPFNLPAACQLVERFTADAEEAFTDLIFRITYAADSDVFASCIANFLEHLDPTEVEYWRLVSSVLKNHEPYKWTFVHSRIEAEAAVLELLGELRSGTSELQKRLKVALWIQAALANIYNKASDVRAAHSSELPRSSTDAEAKSSVKQLC